MSYCVNCGVKLDPSLTRCPLCNAPVINPLLTREAERAGHTAPFPDKTGQVDVVKSRDLAILLSVSLTATGAVCALLNFLIFNGSPWSLYIIGACVVIWVLAIPAVIYTKMPIYICLLCDGLSIALYQYLISFNTPSQNWFFRLALPITALLTGLSIVFALLIRKVSSAFLPAALYFFVEIALFCTGIELLIERFIGVSLRLTWSAVVLAICAVIVTALLTILSRTRLRNAVRRRLHF